MHPARSPFRYKNFSYCMAKISIDMKSGNVAQPAKEMIIGIDLGTTNSLVAYIVDGQPVAVRDADGKSTLMPSVVHFTETGKVEVGDAAKEKLIEDPANTIYSVKRLMGKSYKDLQSHQAYFGYQIIDEDADSLVKVRVKNSWFTPVELSAEILKALKKRIEQQLGATVEKAVITVPAYFNDAQRQATRDAGKLAGLDVLRIVNEPTAASLAYGIGLEADADEQRIAVYDLGGGTFDISILSIQQGIFEVLATNGDTFLGGDDFDRLIIDHWMAVHGWEPATVAADKSLSQRIRLAAEEAKKQLSSSEQYVTEINGTSCSLSRQVFDQLAQPLVEKTLDACRQALRDASLSVSQIDHVVLVGGSTRMPVIKEAVAAFFGSTPYDKLNPDEVVALGAAIQADVLAGNQKDILLLDITPLSLGIETVGGLMDVIIPRNAKVPAKVGRKYTTSVDGQTKLKIAVYQGERDLVEHNRKLGEFILTGIPPMAAGLPKIEVHFYIDADGILKVKAQELRSGVEQEIVIKSQYGISEEDMARMLLESIQHAGEDMAVRSLLEARNEARSILLSAEKFVEQNGNWMTAEEVDTLTALAAALQQAVEGEDKDAIHQAIDALNTFSNPLAEKAFDVNVAAALKATGGLGIV